MPSRQSRFLSCSLLVLLFVPATANPQATPPAPGVSEGQKIGTIIKTAVSTAAPGISGILSVLDTIWSNLTKPNQDKATKAEVKTAAQSPAVQNAAKQPQVNAQVAIQPISKVSDELAVIGRFLGPSVTATQYLIVIKTKSTEGTIDWVGISNAWELAKTQIGNLKSVADSDLNKVRDAYLRDRLTQIRNANDTTVVSITQEVTQKNLPDLKTDLATLLSTLANMTAVAGYELAELQADIGDLASWAKGSGAGEPSVPERGAYKAFLDANVH
jgi:hypothetical protein